MTELPFLPLARPSTTQAELDAAAEVLRSGWWTTGPKVAEFERKFAQYLGQGRQLHAVGLSSCTAAMHLALRALGVGPGDEVIVPTWTFAATALVVEWVGARPVLCDVEEATLNINVRKAADLVTPRTKAIMPVHIAGYPCDMEAIAALAREKRLFVVEDAAHAIGTRVDGRLIGGLSDVTCFSFYATKNLAMGEGGAAVSADPELVERIRHLSYFGIDKKNALERYGRSGTWRYNVAEMGFKDNLDSVRAAIGLVQLARLEAMNARRREIAASYRERLSPKLVLPVYDERHVHSYHLFIARIPQAVISRDEFVERLREQGIGTSVHFIPLHLHTHFASAWDATLFPMATRCFEEVVSLPLFPDMTDDDVDRVVETVNQVVS